MIVDIITIFPKMFDAVFNQSIIKRAQDKGLLKVNIHNLRDYSNIKGGKVDAPSFGGGPGMVFRPEPLFAAAESILGQKLYPRQNRDPKKRIVFFTPQGKILNQARVKKFLGDSRLILIAGHYEGIDQRVRDTIVDDEISIGDYVLSGGELPVMVFVDALTRSIAGVTSFYESVKQESFQNKRFDYPHYTQPREFRGLKVPELLLSGNHQRIKEWRDKKAEEITRKNRPDLLEEEDRR